MPEVIANLIKPAKVSSVDFDAISIVAEKVKNVAKFSPPDEKERETSETSQDLVHSDLGGFPKNCLDFCNGSRYLENKIHEFLKHTLVNSGILKTVE